MTPGTEGYLADRLKGTLAMHLLSSLDLQRGVMLAHLHAGTNQMHQWRPVDAENVRKASRVKQR